MRKFALPHFGSNTRRWLRRGALAWAAWLALGTLLLNQPLMDDWVSRKPEKLRVDWDFAISLVPGHVIAWGLDLRGQVRGVAFGANARRGSGWLVPWALLQKQIRVSGASATGLAVALRPGRVVLPRPAARERPWSLVLSGASFTELWSLSLPRELTVTGRGRGHLALRKVLAGGELEVGSSDILWQELQLHAGGLPLLQGGELQARLALAPLVMAGSTSLQKLRALSLALDLKGSLLPLSLDRKGLNHAQAAERQGQVLASLTLVDGVLADDSRITLSQPVRVDLQGIRDERDLVVDLGIRERRVVVDAVLPKGERPATSLAAHLEFPLPKARQLRDAGSNPARDALPRLLLGQMSGTVDLNLHFRSLRMLRPWLSKWKGLTADGKGWMRAALAFEQGRLLPESTVRFQDVQLIASAMDHGLEARLDGSLLPVEGMPGRRRVELQQVRLLGPGKALLLQDAGAQLELVMQPGAGDLLRLPGLSLRLEDAAIPDIAVLNTYLPPGAVTLGKGAAALTLGVDLEAEDGSAHGELQLRAPAVLVQLGDMRLQGRLGLDTELRNADFERKTLDLRGIALSLRDVSFDGPEGRAVTGWSMDATVDAAHAQVAAPLRVTGKGRVAMSDLRLLLSVYSQISDYPIWILRLADAGRVEAQGKFSLGDGRFTLAGVHASNERFEVDAGLELGKQLRRGALLASWGPLAVAVELGASGSRMHLKDARDWYRAQAAQAP